MMDAGAASFFGLGLQDGHVQTVMLSTVVFGGRGEGVLWFMEFRPYMDLGLRDD